MYIFIRQYVISSLQAPTKMAKIGKWRIIINLQYLQANPLDLKTFVPIQTKSVVFRHDFKIYVTV